MGPLILTLSILEKIIKVSATCFDNDWPSVSINLKLWIGELFMQSYQGVPYKFRSNAGLDKLISMRPIFRAHNFTSTLDRAHKRMGAQNQSPCPIEKELTFWQKGSCNLNVVWMSKIRCVSKNNFQTSDYPPKGVQENMLKAWNFTKNKLLHKCFVNNLQKKFRANILANGTAQMFLIVL